MKKNVFLAALLAAAACGLWMCGHKSSDRTTVGNSLGAKFSPSSIYENVDAPDSALIFIDASISMKPYFTPKVTKDIVQMFQGLKGEHNTSIYFLGNTTKHTGYVTDILNYASKQADKQTTTFDSFFRTEGQLADTSSNLVFLVTDGIMSIGPTKNTEEALIQLGNRIKYALQGKKNLAAAIFRYKAPFKGTYTNQLDKGMYIDTIRPFYVIALGQKQYMRWLKDQAEKKKLANPEGALYIGLHDLKGHAKATQTDSLPKINPLETVMLTVDLPPCLHGLTQEQLDGAVVTNNGKRLNIPVTRKDDALHIDIPYNTIDFSPDGAMYTTVITIPNTIPGDWTSTWHTQSDLAGPDSVTTFGLKYLVTPMFEALEGDEDLLKVTFKYRH